MINMGVKERKMGKGGVKNIKFILNSRIREESVSAVFDITKKLFLMTWVSNRV